MDWHLRDAAPTDLEDLVRLDDTSSTAHVDPAFPMAEVVAAIADRHPAVVAVRDGVLVGAAVSAVSGDTAWILRLTLHPDARRQGLGSALIRELEQRLVARGTRRVRGILPDAETGTQAFLNSGFRSRGPMLVFEKEERIDPHAARLLRELGGEVLPDDLWDRISGMAKEKELIERRVILPLAQSRSWPSGAGPGAAPGDRAIRPAGNRQDDLRQGRGRVASWLAVRGAVPVSAGGGRSPRPGAWHRPCGKRSP